ncbi:acyl-CoA/acyl-ACP dehydrogenase [Amycolatopsis sp. K13G38]|uniref:Acyl-CoA/acyl-ACP dehydrogenase n=1 Tax=Amycolatopsis acididurans TaxID=2724524 RepID=A0ABX1JCI6_9PSEU|nr:acyl-CoA dehydrogenase family protein [Amycolatopsis acididurans]NKQ56095.1 acyl-CoA/acyl-ACP dehydrogenase [Amycolatopsis acididurans]
MRFTHTEMSADLRDATRKLLTREWSVDAAKRSAAGENDDAEKLWKHFASLGWPGIAAPSAYGGGSGSLLDLAAVAEEMGRAVAPTQLYSTVVAAEVLGAFGTKDQKDAYLRTIVDGSLRATVALDEPALTAQPDDVPVRAVRNGGWLLTGTRWFVAEAVSADVILMAAATSGGPALFIVPTQTDGLTLTPLATTSGPGQAVVTLSGVRIGEDQIVGSKGAGPAVLRRAREWAQCLQLADVVGVGAYVLEKTVAYVKQRIAFGVPIGSFQAVQHHLANMSTELDCAEMLAFEAIELVDRRDPAATIALARAQSFAPAAVKRATLTAHQLHGGAGEVLEDDLYLYSNRAKRAELTWGTPPEHLARVAEELAAEAGVS